MSSRFAALCLFMVLAIGCAKATGPSKVPVAGTVSLDGKPLPTGTIYFKTVATGDIDAFPIKDGQFQGQTLAGLRRVEVSVLATKTMELNGMKNEVKVDSIPARYNVNSELTATVDPAGTKTLSFDLKSS